MYEKSIPINVLDIKFILCDTRVIILVLFCARMRFERYSFLLLSFNNLVHENQRFNDRNMFGYYYLIKKRKLY